MRHVKRMAYAVVAIPRHMPYSLVHTLYVTCWSVGQVDPAILWRCLADLFPKHIEDHGEVIHAWVAPRGEHPVEAFAWRLHLSR